MDMMSRIRQARAVTQVVGRRTTLRYLAVGLGASILAACSKNSGDSRDGDQGPVGQAVSAFVRGVWHVELSSQGNEPVPLRVGVTASSYTIEPDEEGAPSDDRSWEGKWAIRGSKLYLDSPTSPDEAEIVHQVTASDIPATIGETLSLRLVWHIPGSTDDDVRIEYAKGTLHIVHIDGDGIRTECTCTRI
ncbi:hypothetical protein GT045_02115 [Streptomyces sp. SID486]|uniref:hypothetical protein n=1 Tax=unclassified Streptomyces TaxID=2593676 RepID=UPI001370C28B|nr:hypothetical protein [Streptomyces sp. SID486]MYX93640.1 hypothetical protein [Streptomyces sp. SID486]